MFNLIGVLIAFVLIIILIRKKFNFGLSLIIGALIIGLFSLGEIDVSEVFKAIIEASFYKFNNAPISSIIDDFDINNVFLDTIELALLMTLIYVLAKLMQETGEIQKLIDSLRTIFTKGGTIGVIPAIYGLMPVPGGALFSAPTIDKEGEKYKLDQNQKNFLNIWFRHIWFPIYPISSAMLTLVSFEFANIDVFYLILANVPAFIISIIIGYFYLKKFLNNNSKQEIKVQKNYKGLIYLLPPIIPLFFYFLHVFIGFPEYRAFIIGVILSILVVLYWAKISLKEKISLIKKSLTLKLVSAIFGIMIFRQMIEVSGASNAIADILQSSFFPAVTMIVLLPLILGLLTGYNLAAVALSYPIVAAFFPSPIDTVSLVGFCSLISISAIVGYLVSPIHLCNVLSSDYLKTDTTRMYKMFVPSVVLMLLIQIIVISAIIIVF